MPPRHRHRSRAEPPVPRSPPHTAPVPQVQQKSEVECIGEQCTTNGTLYNKSTFCKKMNDGTMYPGYPLVRPRPCRAGGAAPPSSRE